jgi:ribulose 1,5-bisphosphate synthetase/thiazole synthase
MKKLILLLLVVLTSCASRKVDVSKTEIKKDSIVETKVEVKTLEVKNTTDSTNIVTEINTDEVCIEPLDSTREMVVDGKIYKNVVLKIKKNKVNTSYTNNKRESNIKHMDSISASKTSVKENIVTKTKNIDKKANYWSLLWLLLLLLIMYLLWRNKQRILNVL